MVRPSIQPSSRRCATKAAVHGPKAEASAPKKPMVGSFPACCASAASGHAAAAPPNSVMKSRRLIASPEPQDEASYLLNLAHWKGLGLGLGRSSRTTATPPSKINENGRGRGAPAGHSAHRN